MASRKTYHIVPNQDGWKVQAEGAQRASSSHDNKAAAVDRARQLAKAQPLGQMIIHKRDGSFQTEHTYGKDPHPPKG